MTTTLELAPKTKRPAGVPCCEPVAEPDIDRAGAERIATLAKALGDPIRVQIVDVLRKHAGEVCVCELVPLFDLSQPTVSHHLKVLRDAGIVESEKQGLWAYYYVVPGALDELAGLRAERERRRDEGEPGERPQHRRVADGGRVDGGGHGAAGAGAGGEEG